MRGRDVGCAPWRQLKLLSSSLLLWGLLPVGLGCTPEPEPPSNLVLVSLDTVSPRRMSTYGAARETTPAISALAARGLRFERAYTVSPWTLPAHAAMLTGYYPSSLARNPNDERLYRVKPLLAQMFHDRGHATGAVTGGFYTAAERGLDRGFDHFDEAGVGAAIEWLESVHERPFFLFFHTYVAHEPYRDRRYVGGRDAGRLAGLYRPALEQDVSNQVKFGGIQPSQEERKYVLDLYDGGVASADAMVGKLLAALQRLAVEERTVVVVTSDHGEEFWEHTGRGAYHGHTLYEELLRIPLVWFDPQLEDVPRVVDEPVSLIDLVPSFVSRFDLAPRPGLDGVDLTPLLRGDGRIGERPLFAEAVRNGPPRSSVRTSEGLYIEVRNPNIQNGKVLAPIPVLAREELYLPTDTGQRHNVARRRPELLSDLKTRLREHQRGGAKHEPSMPVRRLGEKERRALESIGYLE